MDLISVIVPCFNEEEVLPLFYDELNKITKTIKKVNFEFWFIDDGSVDKTLDTIKKYSKKDKRVNYISFSRNFGKEAAILAGLENANGNYVTLLDADLQDPPALLEIMYDIIKKEDYDCIAARRINRSGEPLIRSYFTKKFYKIIKHISNIEMVEGARDYRLMTRKMVDSILSLKETTRYSKGLFSYVGFKTKWVTYENVKRAAGKTKWSFFQLLKYGLEGIISFSTFPLMLSVYMGLLFCFIAFIFIIIIIFKTLIFGDAVSGWPSLACIILFCSGVQLFCFGILGEYISKIYIETKNRPLYITKERFENKK